MTLDEALQFMAAAIIVVITEAPGHKITSPILFHAIVEEWLDGRINVDESLVETIKKYGPSAYQQAARVIANKVDIYGDVQ